VSGSILSVGFGFGYLTNFNECYFVQRGDAVKNWKSRFFVAYNKADNFKIDYLDGTNETGKLKGTIHCAGYRAYEFNSDDIAEFGEPGIKLVPWSYRRRTWWIKCADDQERKEWMSIFENACYKAQPPQGQGRMHRPGLRRHPAQAPLALLVLGLLRRRRRRGRAPG
jgi:hypothetical protein